MQHQQLLDSTDNEKTPLAKGNENFTSDKPRDESKELLNTEIKEKKKNWLIYGIGGLVLIAIVTVILVFALKKDNPPSPPSPPQPTPPDPDIPHYNPYEVIESDPISMSYKLTINPNLKDSFKFPYNDTVNNYRFTNISLNGEANFNQGQTLRFTFRGDANTANDVRVHKKKSTK